MKIPNITHPVVTGLKARIWLEQEKKKNSKVGKFLNGLEKFVNKFGAVVADGLGADVVAEDLWKRGDNIWDDLTPEDITDNLKMLEMHGKDLEAIAKQATNSKPKLLDANHPSWWFKGSKASYFKPEDYAVDNRVLKNLTVHTLGIYAPFSLTPTLQDKLYEAYEEYYKRLNIGVVNTHVTTSGNVSQAVASAVVIPHNKSEVYAAMKAIIEYSWRAVTGLLELQRMESGYLISTNGSRMLLMGLLGYAQTYNNGLYAANTGGSSAPLWPATWTVKDTSNVNEFFGTKAAMLPAPSPVCIVNNVGINNTRRIHGNRYDYGNISNAEWQSLVARVKDLVAISDSAWEYARYLYEGIFIDQPKEDNAEAYVFVSDVSHGNANEKWWLDTTNLKASIEEALDTIEYVLREDRAYKTLLMYLNLMGGKSHQGLNKWEFRRDLVHRTLLVKETDDAFYSAIQNAALMIRYPSETNYSTGNEENPFGTNDLGREFELNAWSGITSWSIGGPQRGRIFKGVRSKITVGKDIYREEPEETVVDMGDIASSMKFGGIARLRYYSRLQWVSEVPKGISVTEGGGWVLTGFNMTSSTVYTDLKKNGIFKEGLPVQYPVGDTAVSAWNWHTRQAYLNGMFSVFNGFNLYYKGLGGIEDDPKLDYILRLSNPGFQEIDVLNLDTVLLYQYSNLYMGVGTNAELNKKLEVAKDWFSTSDLS